MSGVGGPGGIGGPKGPGGPGPVDDVPDVADASDVGEVAGAAPAAGGSPIDALAAELAAGKLTAHEAIDKLVDQIAGSEQLSAADRADLRELLSDLIANDPHLAALANRVG